MALAPLPPDNTVRWWLNYSVAGIGHTLQMRGTEFATDANALNAYNALLDELDPVLASNATFLSVDRADQGSNVRNPVIGFVPRSGAGAFTTTGDSRAFQISFTGRSDDGRKVKYLMWGVGVTSDGDFRWEPGDIAYLDDALATFPANNKVWATISGLIPVMHPYTNYGYNDHTVRSLR